MITLMKPYFSSELFVGPHGENSTALRDAVMQVIDDNQRWRQSLYAGDPSPWVPDSDDPTDRLVDRARRLSGRLHGTMPFHSTRWLAHQQADPMMSSLVGAMAGTLAGGNITASESTSAGIIMEVEATAKLCELVGFQPPPSPDDPNYVDLVKNLFAWAHLTSGGTAANLEALWAARTARYLPFAVRAIAREQRLSLRVSKTHAYIDDCTDRQLLALDPYAALNLPYQLAHALVKAGRYAKIKDARERAEELLSEESASLAALTENHPPVVFAPGSAHYSIDKAADVCGMGRDNLVFVDVDSSFRMNIADLKHKYRSKVDEGYAPIAVIGVLGTTEEGAVDPIEEIVKFRDQCSGDGSPSFWIHVDGAWGGYFASLFRDSPLEAASRWIAGQAAAIDPRLGENPASQKRWMHDFMSAVRTLRSEVDTAYENRPDDKTVDRAQLEALDIDQHLPTCDDPDRDEQQRAYALGRVARWFITWAHAPANGAAPYFTEDQLQRWSADEPYLRSPDTARTLTAEWDDGHGRREHLRRQVAALPTVDSVTIDPHKMGYAAYPAGAVLFRCDQTRDILTQKAPYLQLPGEHGGAGGTDTVIRAPLYHRDQNRVHHLGSPALWTLEGSRPAAAAASLWASIDALSLDRRGYGHLMKTTIESADRLAQLLAEYAHHDATAGFEFIVVPRHPDSNIVTFLVKPGKTGAPASLADTSELTEQTMRQCTILHDEGVWDDIETRSAILSKTEFKIPKYPSSAVRNALHAASIDPTGYEKDGLVVLRAVVANPYLPGAGRRDDIADKWLDWDPLQQFVDAVADAARNCAR